MPFDVRPTPRPPQGRRRSDQGSTPTRLVPKRSARGKPTDLELLELRFKSALRQRASRTREVIARGRHPVLVRMEDRLVLVVGRYRREFEASERHLTRLRAISQVPVEVFMGLTHATDGAIEKTARRLKRRIDQLPDGLCSDATDTVRTASRLLVAHGLARKGQLGAEAVSQFHASLRPAIERLVSLATEHEARQLRQAIDQMELTLPPVDWSQAVCVNCTGPDSGYSHLVEQVMERWLERYPDAFCNPHLRVLRLEGRNDLEHALDHALDLAAAGLAGGPLAESVAAGPSHAGPRIYDEPAEARPVVRRQAG